MGARSKSKVPSVAGRSAAGRGSDTPTPPGKPRDRSNVERWLPFAAGVALVAMTFLAYLPALSAKINIFDDHDYILRNPLIKSFDGLIKMWAVPRLMPQYYPLTYTTYWGEYQLWGFDPPGYHAVNILIHGAAAVLLWRLLARLAVPGAWWAAAVFAEHPVCVESVAWVAEQKNTLSLALGLASMLCYLRFSPADDRGPPVRPVAREWLWYVAAFILYAAALLSKTSVLTVPAVLLVITWWKRGRIAVRDVAWLAPYFALGIALGVLTSSLEFRDDSLNMADWEHTPLEKVLIAGRALWFYAEKLVWPHPLIHFYPQWKIDTGVWWQYFYPLAALALIAALWLARGRIGRGPLAAVLIFAGVLVPGLGFFKIYFLRHTFVADHFQYHACPALIAMAAAAATLGARKLPPAGRSATAVAGVLLIVLLMGLSFAHARTYQDMATLQQDVVDRNPESWISYQTLGIERGRENNFVEAERLLREAVRMRPDEPLNHLTLAHLLIKMLGDGPNRPQQVAEIAAHLEEALRLKPAYVEAHFAVAMTRMQQGRPESAIEHLQAALEIEPEYCEAREIMAGLLAQRGDFASAERHYAEVVRLEPENATALNLLAATLLEQGKPYAALRYLDAARRLQPDSAEIQAAIERAQAMQRDSRHD